MLSALNPFQFLVISVAGWMNQHQRQVIEYLIEENRVLREQIGTRRMRFTDEQRRRLAVKAKILGRKMLSEVASIVTPETLLAWHRKLTQRNTTEANVVVQRSGPGSRLKRLSSVWQKRTGLGAIVGYKEPWQISATRWPTIRSPES